MECAQRMRYKEGMQYKTTSMLLSDACKFVVGSENRWNIPLPLLSQPTSAAMQSDFMTRMDRFMERYMSGPE